MSKSLTTMFVLDERKADWLEGIDELEHVPNYVPVIIIDTFGNIRLMTVGEIFMADAEECSQCGRMVCERFEKVARIGKMSVYCTSCAEEISKKLKELLS